MAGSFPGTSNTQQHDINGQPLAGALLTVYIGGTTTLASTFQDIGLLIPTTNPLVADASGRIPLFFVADGTYALRLTDQFGLQSNGGYFYPQIPSIGASASGGGGTPVDPTTVASTGDLKVAYNKSVIAGWVRMNARTVGNATSGASERANADVQALFVYLWNIDTTLVVVGGRGASGLADFNAGKQITLPDLRGRVLVGLDDMGGADSGRLGGGSGLSPGRFTLGYGGGEGTHPLIAGEIPSITSNGSASVTSAANVTLGNPTTTLTSGGTGSPFVGFTPGTITLGPLGSSGTASVTSNNTGGVAHNNVQPSMLITHYIKL